MIDFNAVSSVLEKVILPSVTEQMYQRAPMWQLIGGWSAKENVAKRANIHVDRFENNLMYIPIRTQYNSGIVSIAVGEKYQYGSPTLNLTNQPIRTIVGSFTIAKEVLNIQRAGAVVKPLMYYSQALSYDLAMDANRQVYGAGDGVIATTASSGSSSTNLVLAPSVNGDITYERYLPVGTWIFIGNNASPVQVTAVVGTNQVTISTGQTWTTGSKIIKATGSNTDSTELDGLREMISNTTTYQSLSPTSDITWSSSAVNTTTESLTTTTLLPEMHTTYLQANAVGRVNWIVMNAHAFQLYGESLTGQIRYDQKEVLSGGWAGLQYMGGNAMILLDYDCPDDHIFFLTVDDLVFGQYQPLEFEKGTDGTLLKIQQTLTYEVTASWMGNLGTVSRKAQGKMSNKTFSV